MCFLFGKADGKYLKQLECQDSGIILFFDFLLKSGKGRIVVLCQPLIFIKIWKSKNSGIMQSFEFY